MGAAGGVGTIAVQILRAEGVEVVATCGPDAIPLLQNLGVARAVDYTSPESDSILVGESPYDIILDCAGKGCQYANTLNWTFGSYITFKSPLLKNFDSHGLMAGGLFNARDLIRSNIAAVRNGPIKWGYFMPAQSGIEYMKELAEKRQLTPVIDSTFTYDDLPAAYKKVQDGHLRGKVVVDFTKSKNS
jgi:reticulon-4-interacting protein 1, mitochondrial